MQKANSVAGEDTFSQQGTTQLQDRNRLYAEIVRNMPVGLSVWRLENSDDVRTFTLILSNPAARKASGSPIERFYGKTVEESFPGLLETGIAEVCRAVVLSGEARDLGEIRYSNDKLGETVVSAKAFPLLNKCVGVVFENITERKKAEETIANQAQLLDLASDAILVRNLDGKIAYWNRGAERMYGWTTTEALGEQSGSLLQTDFPEPLERIKQKLFREGHWEGELQQTRKDGSRIIVASRWTLQRDRDGTPLAWLQISSDATEHKRAERALREAEELARRTNEITMLSQMSSLLQACLTAQEAYSVIAQCASKLFPTESGALCVLSSSRNLVEAVAVWGDSQVGEEVFNPDDCWALRSGRIHMVEEFGSALLCPHLSKSRGFSHLCVPMVAQGDALGLLHIQSRQPPAALAKVGQDLLPPSKQQLAITVAEQIGLALANLKLRDTLRVQSIRDPLTGLFNRRYMEESLERDLRRAARKQGTLGIILLDIDNFKDYNDALGHEAGDSLLRELSGFLQAHVRGEDIACRYGGDEFVLILPEASPETSRQRAEQLRGGIKGLRVDHHGQSLGTVTLSLGMAVYPLHGRAAEGLLRSADNALYEAKKQGRDRVVVSKGE
jgi:diguanylate cyclase (GGDEF)-like protein/PAS domain S-box-containing protein